MLTFDGMPEDIDHAELAGRLKTRVCPFGGSAGAVGVVVNQAGGERGGEVVGKLWFVDEASAEANVKYMNGLVIDWRYGLRLSCIMCRTSPRFVGKQ